MVLYIRNYDENLNKTLVKEKIDKDKIIIINGETELNKFIIDNKGSF